MIRLTTMPDSPLVIELMRRLEEASIQATVTRQSSPVGLYVGGAQDAVIWIADESEHDAAQKILEEAMAIPSVDCCAGCGYDLRGHHGSATCPECGRPFNTAGADVTCQGCGELVPPTFSVCWSCGEQVGE